MKGAASITLAAAILCAGCADGTIVFIDNDNGAPDTIEVNGNVRDVNPQVAGADLVVFVFTDLVDDGTFQQFTKQRSVAVASDADPIEFTVTQVENGDLTIVFLQDDAGNPDGTIDLGDPIATLEDPDNVLDGTRKGENIEITDIDIDFNTGVADARKIRSVSDSPDTTQ